jgi:tRNA G18 (ribose-2'-O)-methylase SpoU
MSPGSIPTHIASPTWQFGVVLCCQDPYNLGALIRSSLAFGVDAIALWPGAVNPFNHYAIKASAGTAFAAKFIDPQSMLAQARGTTTEVYRAEAHPTMASSSGSWLEAPKVLNHRQLVVPHGRKRVLVLGHETRGVPEEWQGLGHSVHVDMAGSVESLSVNAAGAVLLDRLSCKS